MCDDSDFNAKKSFFHKNNWSRNYTDDHFWCIALAYVAQVIYSTVLLSGMHLEKVSKNLLKVSESFVETQAKYKTLAALNFN